MARSFLMAFAALAVVACSLDYDQLANCPAEDYCEGDVLHSCGPGGEQTTTCEWVCASEPARCAEPSNDVPISTEAGLADFVVGDDPMTLEYVFLSTETGQISTFLYTAAMPDGFAGPDIRGAGEGLIDDILFETRSPSGTSAPLGIFTFGSVDLQPATVVIGGGSHALVLVSQSTFRMDGSYLDVGPDVSETVTSPAGSPRTGVGDGLGVGGGGAGSEEALVGVGGGAGGSFGGSGGAGDGPSSAGGVAGMIYGNPELVPLEGGSSGGAGAGNAAGSGGGGGGALQIVARESIEVLDGRIMAPGGPGGPGQGGASRGGGGGGGSGGAILLESPVVGLRGAVAANGGGGGGGGGGTAGERGGPMPGAAGGMGSVGGGAGGAGSDASGAGTNGASGVLGGGGGGGGGRIRINTLTGTEDYTGVVLPEPATGLSTVGGLRGVD